MQQDHVQELRHLQGVCFPMGAVLLRVKRYALGRGTAVELALELADQGCHQPAYAISRP